MNTKEVDFCKFLTGHDDETIIELYIKWDKHRDKRSGQFEQQVIKKNAEGLLPCPFCGSSPKIGSLGGDNENWMVYCPDCQCASAEMGVGGIDSKEDCIAKWNIRV